MKRLLLLLCLPLFGMDKPTDYERSIRYTYPAGLYWCDDNHMREKVSLSPEMIVYLQQRAEKPKLERQESCEDLTACLQEKPHSEK